MPTAARAGTGANLPVVRDHNAALVLDLVRRGAGISRAELATRTGLTAQAITKIVNRLRADGLLTEAGKEESTGGKPRTRLRLEPGARRAVGIHLDRDDSTVLLTDLTGRPSVRRHLPTGMRAGPERALDAIAAAVAGLLADVTTGRVLGVGVACPGPLDHESGVLHRVTGLPAWDAFPLRDTLARRLDLPTTVDKDSNAAAFGECLAGSPATGGCAVVFLGRGLGAGLVLGGRVYRGPRTNAGEFGHQTVQIDGPACACGNRGCLEALCGQALAAGDHARAADLVGLGAANLVRLLDIEQVALAGPVVAARPEAYRRGVGAAIHRLLPEPDWQQVQVTLAAAGSDAVAVGAAGLILAPLFDPAI